jgi:hypothetical protein
MRPSIICSYSSLQASEPLPGTAPRADVWMLLEYDGVWGEKAFDESHLPGPVKNHLSETLRQIPNSKLLLIRQHMAHRQMASESRLSGPPSKQGTRFFLALTHLEQPLLYDFTLKRYEDLLDLDIPGIAAQESVHSQNLSSQVLLIVCTNGRRDWCCARFGTDTYLELIHASEAVSAPPAIWQSSHLGGHRFAPNIACLPAGLFYGRVEKNELPILIENCCNGRIYPAKARGRSCYPTHLQAAEIYLRMRSGTGDHEVLQVSEVVESQPDEWMVRFRSAFTKLIHSVVIVRETSTHQVFKSCSDTAAVPFTFYKLVDIKEVEE